MKDSTCIFCRIIDGVADRLVVFEDETSLAFLDRRPLFPGHCLLVPKDHYETIADLPPTLIGSFFTNVQLISAAVKRGMSAEGVFIGINNRVSQSVPHLHVHIIPRNRGDGLKGFFWPRNPYGNDDEARLVRDKIRGAVASIRDGVGGG